MERKHWYINSRIYGNGILGGNNVPMGAIGNFNSNMRFGLVKEQYPYNAVQYYFFEANVGEECVTGQRAKYNGFWYQCTDNVWNIVQPRCFESEAVTGGTITNNYTFTSSVSNGAKIAGDFEAGGTRYCFVYNSTSNVWEKKSGSDCGTIASGDAWYGCTQPTCVASSGTCVSNGYSQGNCCTDLYCVLDTCTDYCGCISGLDGTSTTVTNGTKSCRDYCTVVGGGYWFCQASPECLIL